MVVFTVTQNRLPIWTWGKYGAPRPLKLRFSEGVGDRRCADQQGQTHGEEGKLFAAG